MILRPQGLVPSGRAARVMPPVKVEVPHD